MSKNLPWFRLYSESIDDEKLKLLAPSDRWYFVALLCCKCQGILDNGDQDELRRRKIAVKLDLSMPELEELKRRLVEVELIDSDFQPLKWVTRQFKKSERNAFGVDQLGDYNGYVYFIGANKGHVKIGYSKNPWARVKDFQTGTPEKLHILATIKTYDVSERSVHELFESHRVVGEWFQRKGPVYAALEGIQSKKVRNQEELFDYVKQLRGNYVVTTTDTDTDTDTDKNRGKTAKRFVPPTPDEVSRYCKQRNNSVDAGRFVDFYAAKGWMVGKNKMKDWKAAVRTWEANSKTEAPARKRKML